MKTFSRRDVLKTTLLAPAAVAAAQGVGPIDTAMNVVGGEASGPLSATKPPESGLNGAGRERLLLDFGWRFHLGNADDATKDFGFGSSRAGNFQKTGSFMPACGIAFDDSDWKSVDLPHDWAIELPFTNDPALESKGFYPLGRNYPATSIGWYRRVFDIPAEDANKRITVEFDGSYRETMVVFNGFYLGRHSGGYDPFSFDLTDFVIPGGRNVLLVRVDATESDGWFYEGAGIYRHVWLNVTGPVHIVPWGVFVTTPVVSGTEALVSVETRLANSSKADARAIFAKFDDQSLNGERDQRNQKTYYNCAGD